MSSWASLGAYVEDTGGMAIPSTASGYGSLYPCPESSREDVESGEVRRCCLAMFECFRRNRFERGLSCVEAEEPETKDGVRAGSEIGGRATERDLLPTGGEMAFVYLEWEGNADCASSRRSSWPASRRTPPEGGDLESIGGRSMPFFVDGLFFTSFEGEEVPGVEVEIEMAVRVGNRLDAFDRTSTDGSTTRLDPP